MLGQKLLLIYRDKYKDSLPQFIHFDSYFLGGNNFPYFFFMNAGTFWV